MGYHAIRFRYQTQKESRSVQCSEAVSYLRNRHSCLYLDAERQINITFVLSQFVIGGNDTMSPSASMRQGYSCFPFSKSKYLKGRDFLNTDLNAIKFFTRI